MRNEDLVENHRVLGDDEGQASPTEKGKGGVEHVERGVV